MEHVFELLDDEEAFKEYVGKFYRQSPAELGTLVNCTFEVDDARLSLAYNTYMVAIETFGVLLKSAHPDHYKRAGALLHALYKTKPIINLTFTPEIGDVDTMFTPLGVNHAEAEEEVTFAAFYEEYHNEMTAFFLSFGCCSMYEEHARGYSLSYLHDVCMYLKNNDKLSVESLFMLFKSLMH